MRQTRVLLIEDDPAISMIVEEMMMDLGMTSVTTAGRLPAALEAATSGGFDCAIVDLKLHGQETFEVARILTERNIPFAFFTGYAADSLREYASQSVLPKPFGEADLKGILDHLLRSDGSG
jgi:CheY-like chemotaxis protein